jgi:hypothetical protein
LIWQQQNMHLKRKKRENQSVNLFYVQSFVFVTTCKSDAHKWDIQPNTCHLDIRLCFVLFVRSPKSFNSKRYLPYPSQDDFRKSVRRKDWRVI